jgi:hypothetical protein
LKIIRKQLTEDLKTNKDISDYSKRLAQFRDELFQAEKQFVASRINVINQTEPERQYLILDESDKEHLEKYYNLVHAERPQMLKYKDDEYDYDFDFEVDTDNYDPWKEYQLIYRDIFRKGKAYWIIKSMPDWKFLQVGKPNSIAAITHSEYNFKRPNMNDSIFTLLTIERYFDERRSKANLLKGKSQAIRI